MTTIVTRLYPDAKTADKVVAALKDAGARDSMISVLGKGDDMKAAQVPEDSAAAYAAKMDGDNKLVVARIPFMPVGLARKTIKTMNMTGSIDAGVANENAYIPTTPNPELFKTADANAGHIFFAAKPGYSERIGLVSKRYGGFNMLTEKGHSKSVIEGWHTKSAIPGGTLFTGTVDRLAGNPRLVAGGSVIESGTWFSNLLNWRTTFERKA
jgi:hypothetical protein